MQKRIWFFILGAMGYFKKCRFRRNGSREISLCFTHCHSDKEGGRGGWLNHTNSSSQQGGNLSSLSYKSQWVRSKLFSGFLNDQALLASYLTLLCSFPFLSLSFPFSCFSFSTEILWGQVSMIELRCKYQWYVCDVDEHVNESIMYSDCLFVFQFWAPIGDSCPGHNNHSKC